MSSVSHNARAGRVKVFSMAGLPGAATRPGLLRHKQEKRDKYITQPPVLPITLRDAPLRDAPQGEAELWDIPSRRTTTPAAPRRRQPLPHVRGERESQRAQGRRAQPRQCGRQAITIDAAARPCRRSLLARRRYLRMSFRPTGAGSCALVRLACNPAAASSRSITARQPALSSSRCCFMHAVIFSTFGICELQRRWASPLHRNCASRLKATADCNGAASIASATIGAKR
jgi:hypothetical protein